MLTSSGPGRPASMLAVTGSACSNVLQAVQSGST